MMKYHFEVMISGPGPQTNMRPVFETIEAYSARDAYEIFKIYLETRHQSLGSPDWTTLRISLPVEFK